MQQQIWFALPRETMETQFSMIDLLTAMFPEPDELSLDPSNTLLLDRLRTWCANEKAPLAGGIPPCLSLTLNLPITNRGEEEEEEEDAPPLPTTTTGNRRIQLNISVPLQSEEPEPAEAPQLKVTVRQPDWMSKAQVADLSAGMLVAEGGGSSSSSANVDVFSAIEYIREKAPSYMTPQPSSSSSSSSSLTANNGQGRREQAGSGAGSGTPISRVWFYFPSLSTREKRNDLVNHAPSFNLTGFVLAGKPGVLCLEGESKMVDAYMKFIKTESWGDIPSHQKKVSERYREERAENGGVRRVFEDMREITDSLGERRGERANRGDMKALEAWLTERGLGEAFERVIM